MEAHTVLSEGSEQGVAPRSDPVPRPLRLTVEGWRFFPHSYSIVNQQQCLELLNRPGVVLTHRNARVPPYIGTPVMGVLDRGDEDRMIGIPEPAAGDAPDAVYRINYPYDFGPSACPRTFVFVTCERMILRDHDVLRPPCIKPGSMARPFQTRIRENDLTLITPSAWSKAGLERSGIDPARIVVIPHGVNPEVYRPLDHGTRERMRAERGYADTFTFLHVSAMTGNKNPEGIIRAFLAIARKYPRARLVLKGLSDLFHSNQWISQELARLCPADRDLAKRTIAYCGTTLTAKDQAVLFQLADAYVAPYQSEGFCIPVLEAAACGVPVIVSRGGPTDEFTTPDFALPVDSEMGDHHHDGSVWLRTDHASLVAQMERVIEDRGWRERANALAPAYVHGRYSWRAVVDQLVSLVNVNV